jgi:hypothetical protein
MAARMAMIAITTRSSISVKAGNPEAMDPVRLPWRLGKGGKATAFTIQCRPNPPGKSTQMVWQASLLGLLITVGHEALSVPAVDLFASAEAQPDLIVFAQEMFIGIEGSAD